MSRSLPAALDFSVPVDRFFFDPITKGALVDTVLSLTGFALVGGPARQDHPKAIESLKKLDVPYMVTVPLSFQTTEEWKDSTLGLHPVQVALQVALPELDGGLEPIIFSGRDSKSGKSHALEDRSSQIADRAIKWASLRRKKNAQKNLAITVFSFPAGQRERRYRRVLERLWFHLQSLARLEEERLQHR